MIDSSSCRCICEYPLVHNYKTDQCDCPNGQQYNVNSQKCYCPENLVLNAETSHCECPFGTVLNNHANTCQCPGKQVWNRQLKRCECADSQCSQDYIAVEKKGTCECLCNKRCLGTAILDPVACSCVCPPNYIYREHRGCRCSRKCGGQSYLNSQCQCDCPKGASYNETINDCNCPGELVRIRDGSCGCSDERIPNLQNSQCLCPFKGQIYQPIIQQCICPDDKLPSNITRSCECICPVGFTGTEVNGTCKCNCSKECNIGYTLNENECRCVQEEPQSQIVNKISCGCKNKIRSIRYQWWCGLRKDRNSCQSVRSYCGWECDIVQYNCSCQHKKLFPNHRPYCNALTSYNACRNQADEYSCYYLCYKKK